MSLQFAGPLTRQVRANAAWSCSRTRPQLLVHCARAGHHANRCCGIAVASQPLTLTEQITLEAPWISTNRNFADGPSRGCGPVRSAPCRNDLDGIYKSLELSRRERCALGRFSAELQRRRVVQAMETSLLSGDLAGPDTFRFPLIDLFLVAKGGR